MLQQLCCFRERQLFIYLVSPTWGSWAASSAPHGARALLAHPSSASGSCRRVTQLPLPTAPPSHTHTHPRPLSRSHRGPPLFIQHCTTAAMPGVSRQLPLWRPGGPVPPCGGRGGLSPLPADSLLSSPLPACPPQTQPTPAATTSGRRPPGPRCTPRPRTSSSWRGC